MNVNRVLAMLMVLMTTFTLGTAQIHSERRDDDGIESHGYSFRYFVNNPTSGVVMDHWEDRRGEQINGGYGLLEPGGMVRSVHYQVLGSSGIRTVVKMRSPHGSQNQLIFNNHKTQDMKFVQPKKPFQHQKPVALI